MQFPQISDPKRDSAPDSPFAPAPRHLSTLLINDRIILGSVTCDFKHPDVAPCKVTRSKLITQRYLGCGLTILVLQANNVSLPLVPTKGIEEAKGVKQCGKRRTVCPPSRNHPWRCTP